MPRTRRAAALALVAVALDLVAVGVLLADAVAAYRRDLGVLLPLSAIGIPTALAAAVVSGVHLIRSVGRLQRWTVVLGVAVLVVAAVPVGAAVLGAAYSATPNPAASAEATIGRTVEAAGGRRRCGSGDPGLGPDNVQPYYSTVYEVPAGTDLRPRITAQAERLGWTVSSDPDHDLARTAPRLQLDQSATTVSGACGVYGTVERASAGTRLLQLEVLLPYRR